MSTHRNLWQIFRWPLALALASAIGLVSALVADGVWDRLSWFMLSTPVIVGFYKGTLRRDARIRDAAH